jgi:hypothetical protein
VVKTESAIKMLEEEAYRPENFLMDLKEMIVNEIDWYVSEIESGDLCI